MYKENITRICRALSNWSDFKHIPPNHLEHELAELACCFFFEARKKKGKKVETPDLDLHMPFFTRLSLSLDKELNLVVVIIFIYSTSWHSAVWSNEDYILGHIL